MYRVQTASPCPGCALCWPDLPPALPCPRLSPVHLPSPSCWQGILMGSPEVSWVCAMFTRLASVHLLSHGCWPGVLIGSPDVSWVYAMLTRLAPSTPVPQGIFCPPSLADWVHWVHTFTTILDVKVQVHRLEWICVQFQVTEQNVRQCNLQQNAEDKHTIFHGHSA